MEHLINADNVHDYAPVGCLENTMVGNDRSGTVDDNLNLLKAVELTLTGGYDLIPVTDALTGKADQAHAAMAQTPATRRPLPPGSSSGRLTPRRPATSSNAAWRLYEKIRGDPGALSSRRLTSPAWSRAAPKAARTSTRAARS